jgi:prevent-host-death family protein
MDTVNLYEAKTKLSQLVERAAAGEEIVIAKAGRPLARLVPLATRTAPARSVCWQVRLGSAMISTIRCQIRYKRHSSG